MNLSSLIFSLSLVLSSSAVAATQVSKHLRFSSGAINRVWVGEPGKGAWIYQADGEADVKGHRLLLTHSRRDVLPSDSSRFESWTVYAPGDERAGFENPEAFWTEFRSKRFHDYEQQSTKVLASRFPVDHWIGDRDRVEVGNTTLEAIATPGYTRGAITYFGVVDGKRTAFTGDLIYEGGRIIDLYSFQDAIPEVQIRGYHGYAARLASLVSSLERLLELNLDLIVPARGPLIQNPPEAMNQLLGRVKSLYRNYLSTNALNWYFKEDRMRASGERILGKGADISLMPYSTHLETPEWILSQSTSRLIVSDDGFGFLLDCGYQRIIDAVHDWIDQGLVRGIEGIFVTHFHDDHADMVQKAAQVFDCPIYALNEYKDVLEHPAAYHLPAMTSNPMSNVIGMKDGTKMRWREFDFTFHFYPGQAYYHGALMVNKPEHDPIFFVGDSFSPSGMDDYCLLNRNLMQKNTGYFLCLKKLREISGDYWMINEHIPHIFRFSDIELGYLEHRYSQRHDIISELVPWDDPNYGIDEQWAFFYPYSAEMNGGGQREFEVRLTNHSPVSREFQVTPRGQQGVTVQGGTLTLKLPSGGTGSVRFNVQAPEKAGTYLVTADVVSGEMRFENWIEAMILVD